VLALLFLVLSFSTAHLLSYSGRPLSGMGTTPSFSVKNGGRSAKSTSVRPISVAHSLPSYYAIRLFDFQASGGFSCPQSQSGFRKMS
jgi:hypothetical protein